MARGAGPAAAVPTEIPAGAKAKELKAEKLRGPDDIPYLPEPLSSHLIAKLKGKPQQLWDFKGVVRQRQDGKGRFDFRVFSMHEASTKGVKIKNYPSLDEHPDLITYQGWFDKKTGKVEMEEKQ